MCGIAGYVGRFDAELLGRMNESLAHRGPDDSGTLTLDDKNLGLTHRRLSIIDLSPRGHAHLVKIIEVVVREKMLPLQVEHPIQFFDVFRDSFQRLDQGD